jgi:hypothetical protein
MNAEVPNYAEEKYLKTLCVLGGLRVEKSNKENTY